MTKTTSQPDAAGLLADLIRCRSVTPAEGGALTYLAGVLAKAGLKVERHTFSSPGTPDVENLFATIGSGTPHLAFAGHTDVVPPGDEARWIHPPFAADVLDGVMYGRGAVDMKGGIACFVAAVTALLSAGGMSKGTLSFVITGDEEGPGINGTARILDWANKAGHRFDAAIVGEPTCRAIVGDTMKIGRRGSLSAVLSVTGRQGHVAYPQLADNPIPRLIRLLSTLTQLHLDQGSVDFEPSRLEVTTIDVGNPTANLIPGRASARINVRFNDLWTPARVEEWLRAELDAAAGGSSFNLEVLPGASECFLTRPGFLTAQLAGAVRDVTGLDPKRSTNGGTSDARFFKDRCPVVEFGLVGDTMHQVDERVSVADLERLTDVYRRFLERFYGEPR